MDRLLWDEDEHGSYAPGQISESAFIASVARDIEHLLNTRNVRKRIDPISAEGDAIAGKDGGGASGTSPVDASVLMLGLPDFSSLSLANGRHRQALVDAVQNVIATFEPRLRGVRVNLVDDCRPGASLEFSIHATLHVPSFASNVGFEAWFQSMSLKFAVSPSHG